MRRIEKDLLIGEIFQDKRRQLFIRGTMFPKVTFLSVFLILFTCYTSPSVFTETYNFLLNCIIPSSLLRRNSLVTFSKFSSDKLATLSNSDIQFWLVQIVRNLPCLKVFRKLFSNTYALPSNILLVEWSILAIATSLKNNQSLLSLPREQQQISDSRKCKKYIFTLGRETASLTTSVKFHS